ncbi:BamA/TamA family outer membrane protein [Spirochaetota bacterium]
MLRKNISVIFIIIILLISGTELHPFGKNKVNYEDINWKVLKTIHFDIHYPRGMEEVAVKASKISEQAYVHISNYLKHELTEIIPIVIYPSHIAFQNNNIIPYILGEGTGGFTESLKNRVVIPFNGIYHEFRHVLVHELVHAFQYNILLADTSGESLSRFTMGGIPLWLVEGMAEYLSIGFDETADMIMRDALFNDKYADLMKLTRLEIYNVYLLYKEGQSFYYFLEKMYGRHVIGEIFRDLRDIGNIQKVFKINTGKNLEEISNEWLRFFKRRYYHLIAKKKYEDVEGVKLTNHEKTYSSINTCPAVSPDGKKIAYFTNRDIYSNLVVAAIGKKKIKHIKTIIQGNSDARFEGMHLMDNYLTWDRSGRYLVFIAQSNGRDVIFIVHAKNGDIRKEIKVPFRSMKDPSLSPNGKLISFVGAGNGYSDIYIYNLETRRIKRVTNSPYSERYPRILADNKNIVFSAKYKEGGNKHYNIYRVNLKTGKREMLISNGGNNLQVDISKKGERIIFTSNKSGIYNAYTYDLKTGTIKKITDVLSGIFYPRWFPGEKKIAFVSYQNSGYDIFFKKLDKSEVYEDNDLNDTQYMSHEYPKSYFMTSKSVFSNYDSWISNDWLFLGIAYTINMGAAGFVQMAFSDMLGNHRLVFTMNYLQNETEIKTFNDFQDNFNFDLAYFYLKNRWDFGVGIFRQSNPFMILSISSINELIHNENFSVLYMNNYGGYGIASYPFSRFSRMDIKTSFSRYERNYSDYDLRPDIYTNLNQLSFSLHYDNVLWGGMIPADGFRGKVEVEHAFYFGGNTSTFTTVDIDLRKYFLIFKKYIFAFRGVFGKIFGKDKKYFKYNIGGFNTLRGHPFLGYRGENVFIVNAEFRFVFIEGIKFGWPLPISVGRIGGVLFVDMGSAWDNDYNFYDKGKEKFDDFKTDMGVGLRFAFYPLIILKLDFAWPYYMKSFGNMEFIFSLGFEY